MNANELKACHNRLLSLSMSVQEASGGYPPEIVDGRGRFTVDDIQIEVDNEGRYTGNFRKKDRPGTTFRPCGTWPEHRGNYTHELEGHGLDGNIEDMTGEHILSGELNSLYIQNGVEMACDDVPGAVLDPKMVHDARGAEMGLFKGMGVYDRVPRTEQRETGGKIIGA